MHAHVGLRDGRCVVVTEKETIVRSRDQLVLRDISSRYLPKEDMHLALPHLSDERLAFPYMRMGSRDFSGYVPWFVFSLISESCPQLQYLRSFVGIVMEKFGLLYAVTRSGASSKRI